MQIEVKQENAMLCNNRDDLLQLSFNIFKYIFQYFQRPIYNPVKHL